MRLFKFFAIALFIVGSAFTTVNTNKGDWYFLGDKNVGFGVDQDVINLIK